MRWLGFGVALALLGGCGPTFSEARLASYPRRSDDCELDFVDATSSEMSPGGKWKVVGFVSVQGLGRVDPFSPQNKELVRPRICQMGGVAVARAVEGMAGAPATDRTTITYAALRLADEPAQQAATY